MDAPEMTSNPLVPHTPQRAPAGQQQHQQQQQASSSQAPSLSQPDAPRKASAPAASSSASSASSTMASTAPFDAETMQDQLALFVRDGLLDSAQILGELLVALANAAAAGVAPSGGVTLSRAFHGTSFRLFADLLVAKREFKRALQYYKRSWKIQIGSTNASASPEAVALKVKMGECWIAMDGAHQAIEVLNSVPVPLRSLTVHLLLGKLYLGEGLVNKAEESYRAAVRLNPYALEATLALADITATREAKSVATPSSAPGNLGNVSGLEGAPSSVMNPAFWQKELETFYAKLATTRVPTSGSPPVTSRDAEWLQTLASAHVHANRGRHRAAQDAFNALNRLFPHNLHCVLHKGKLDMEQEFYHEAHKNFDRARQIDDQNLRMMDSHADCLRRSNAPTSLNTLVQHLFDTSEDHVESWLAGAFFCDMKGEHETALQFCDRAIAIDRRYAPAFLFRGTLLLQQMRPELAAQAFKESCKLSKTLEAYSGMVTSYCEMSLKGLNKYKEALTTAKTVVKLYPQKAQSYVLLGNVLALRPETADQAKKAYQRAHAADPRKLAAVFGLVDLLVREGNVPLAIERLQAFCDQTSPREEVLTKLADVYTLNKQFQEAIGFYHRALSANPSSADAARGLERLEKIMRGEDPDELNSTMEHMEGDEQDDSMDAGEYVTS